MLENALIDRSTLTLLVIDLDGFKAINDRFGHGAGDDVLRHVATALRHNARGGDLIARLGGDEFVIALEHCSETEASRMGEKILATFASDPCLWAGQPLPIKASIGVAVSDLASDSAASWTSVLEHADLACYDAKARGGNRVHPYREDGTAIVRLSKARRLAVAVEHALESSALRLAARPIVPLQNATELAHCELHARLSRSAETTVTDLARVAAQNPDLARRIDRWAIATGFLWVAKNHGARPSTARWFINLSAASLEDPDLIAYIDEQRRETRAPAVRIGFELDESALTERFTGASALVPKLRDHGFETTLDGFGRYVSSLASLKALGVHYVKIDWSTLCDNRDTDASLVLLKSLHQINRTMNRRTIVQGVNSSTVVGPITLVGVDYAQGTRSAARTPRAPADLPSLTNGSYKP